jgi:deoxyribonuclease (pyrimidine dimer)
MRVNVIHPIFLSDQHLVAEYREVKMGPKALSRSLGSIKGVDKKKISPAYTLNTGHTYFFYDKNLFLEKRLELLVGEMKFRGFATNHIELIDTGYDYHPNTFDGEWWNDWIPDEGAAKINLDRINERFLQKSLDPNTRGWYKFFGMSVPDMETIIKARKDGFVKICNCNAIIDESSLVKTNNICWWCCKKIEVNNLETIPLTNKIKIDKPIKEIKKVEFDSLEDLDWRTLKDFLSYLKNIEVTPFGINENLQKINKFIQNNLREPESYYENTEDEYKKPYDEFDLENLGEIISILIYYISNKREILDKLLKDFREEEDLKYLKEYFSQVL